MQNKTANILVIDDDKEICFTLRSIFEFQQWVVSTVCRVRDGLTLLQQEKFDLVLIDYHMPEVNGISGVQMIRGLLPDIPILVLTIDNDQTVADRFLAAGADDFALKPVKAPDIISRVKLHLQLSRQRHTQVKNCKGISSTTLYLIKSRMREVGDYITVEDLSQRIGMAYPTVYRYIKYLIDEELVESHSAYGKVGRPKQAYRLKE